ncbi:TlpA family protein disulfide reductase [Aeoliella sp. ICT_H6.2]|uniref:TlpA family protein disulfide reductase n=1 Tax=Aeoliella straminimaris TaxID=2954799 RepID=A0A9X2JHI7_9BACT|nr:TlpA family protein disulfide reductase [Aeoliella straminimaris]
MTIGIGKRSHTLDIEQGSMNSPRVVETLTGDGAIEVTVKGNLKLPDELQYGKSAYVSGGLLAMRDERNYLRLERASFSRDKQSHHYLNFELRRDGRRVRMGRFADYPIDAKADLRLRMEMSGQQIRALVRRIDGDWHEMGTANLGNSSALQVGIHALNTSGESITIDFESLRRERELAPARQETSSHLALNAATNRTSVRHTVGEVPLVIRQQLMALQQRTSRIDELTEQERDAIIDDIVKLVRSVPGEIRPALALTISRDVSRKFEMVADYGHSLQICDQLAESLESSSEAGSEEALTRVVQLREQISTRAEMIGEPLELEGELIEGGTLNWDDYRGSVVLVDFWASWCGPCRREMPNVIQQYDTFRDQGFKVLGVCLDTDRNAARTYIAESEMTWPSLFVDDGGWNHPMAQKYSIRSIPTAILVGRDGRVLSFSARGEQLERLLKKQLDTPSAESEQVTTEGAE